MNATTVRVAAVLNLSGAFAVAHQVYKDRYFKVSCLHVTNNTAAPATVQMCVVPNGGTPVQANALMWDYPIPANDFLEMADGLLLAPSASLVALCSVPGAINVFVSGTET